MTTEIREWTSRNTADPNFCMDEAEAAAFNGMVLDLPSFDPRSPTELEECVFSHREPRERERALWELAYRDIEHRGELIQRGFRTESDPLVRANMIWLTLKVAPSEAHSLISLALHDDHPEVRDWARLYDSELRGKRFDSEYRSGVFIRGTCFDQTLPLQIAGFAVVGVPGGDRRVVLSPSWFAHIQGRVMACTRNDTFMTDLTIEKTYFGYHPDGSDHYEIYPFRGKSWDTSDGRTQHRYLAKAIRPTYLSGKVEEEPVHTVVVPMNGNRAATTGRQDVQVVMRDADGHSSEAVNRVVTDVRGQYFGWAFASLHHYLEAGDIQPGTVQLVSPVEDETAPLVNCYICGTFRGKLSDHNGDGMVDINEIPCHGTPDGRLDYSGDGSFAADPFA